MTIHNERARVTPFEIELDRLHELICEGRNREAIELMREMFSNYDLRSYDAQRNLFPDRIVA